MRFGFGGAGGFCSLIISRSSLSSAVIWARRKEGDVLEESVSMTGMRSTYFMFSSCGALMGVMEGSRSEVGFVRRVVMSRDSP